MFYSIGEFSKITQLGIHTLRYYEKENLIKPQRTASNKRCYTENDVKWVEFIIRLKKTGMPIKEIQKYAKLRSLGDSTLEERMEMLIQHRYSLYSQIDFLKEQLEKLDDKIQYYHDAIEAHNIL